MLYESLSFDRKISNKKDRSVALRELLKSGFGDATNKPA